MTSSEHDFRLALAVLFSRLGRELIGQLSSEAVLKTIADEAFDVVPAADHVAISLGQQGRFETIAATSDVAARVDQIQFDLGHGPSVDAVVDEPAACIADLATSSQWPEFGRRASEEYGVRSMLSVRIYLEDDDLLVALNVYAAAPDAFDISDRTTATLLATHGALALTAVRRQDKIDNLERALRTSRRIGTAIGILMATYRVADEQAFDLLRIASQTRHRKLADIAEDVVLTGMLELPQPPERRDRDHR